uniref:type I restriction endonuclease n=1 Tax=Rhodoferax sp. TaxID=50421 RepID=UPI00374CC939
MSTDTSERGLETLIVRYMTGTDGLMPSAPIGTGAAPTNNVTARPQSPEGWQGYLAGSPKDYDRAHALDVYQLFAFLRAMQPEAFKKLAIVDEHDGKDINRLKFLTRLSSELGKRGVIDLLRKGIEHHPAGHFDLFYGTPSEGNVKSQALHAQNRFVVTRQFAYSLDEARRALDLGLFVNGLPVATFELKNSLTKQTVEDAVEQYKRDRDPREKLFEFGRCVVHFAVDDSEVRMCTQLAGKASWFLPLNKGFNDGAGNPPNPLGLKTDYLWKELLTTAGLTNILENYAQIVEVKNARTGKKKRSQVFPRYHQLGVVRKALASVRAHGVGKRYLIQHSAGSGKSNSIAWLSHQLIGAKRDGKAVFDSVIVVTDRRILDDQIQKTIKQFMQVGATVGAVTGDASSKTTQLQRFIADGKKIIISTIQTFPFVLKVIGDEHRGRNFAILIDEAHSSQSGKTAASMSATLGDVAEGADSDTDPEDVVNDAIAKRMAARKMMGNASYFAFTATPKNRTLEMFGE